MNALLVNNEHEIAEINRKELISSRMLDKSIDHDLPDDFEELVLDVPKVSNEIFQLTKRVRTSKNIEDDADTDSEWF